MCANKTLLTKIDSVPDLAHGLQFADSCSRMAIIATILFWNISGEGAYRFHLLLKGGQ